VFSPHAWVPLFSGTDAKIRPGSEWIFRAAAPLIQRGTDRGRGRSSKERVVAADCWSSKGIKSRGWE
jgi:hypothetical protein